MEGPTIDLKRNVDYSRLDNIEDPQSKGQVAPMDGKPGLPAPGMSGAPSVHAVITAQAIPDWAKRKTKAVLQKLNELCALNGSRYVYEWDVNDHATRTKKHIFDLSIKATNDLVRTYGNCQVDIPHIQESAEGWYFYARFVDYETGFTLVRPFFQSARRKGGQDTSDSGRRREGLFAMGVSKAERNVVKNALDSFCEHMKEELQRGVLTYVKENRDKIEDYVDRMLEELGISEQQLAAVVGRRRKDWTVRNAAQAVHLLRSIEEGHTTVEEQFPSEREAENVQAELDAREKAEQEKRDQRTAEKTGTDAGDRAATSGEGDGQGDPAKGEGAPGRARSTPSPEAEKPAKKAKATKSEKPAESSPADDQGSSGTGQPAPGAGDQGGTTPAASNQGEKMNTAADALEKGAGEAKAAPAPKEPDKPKAAPAPAAVPAKAKETPDDSKPWWE